MAMERKSDFCTAFRKETAYKLRKKTVQKVIRDKTYEFEITAAICDECGGGNGYSGAFRCKYKSH